MSAIETTVEAPRRKRQAALLLTPLLRPLDRVAFVVDRSAYALSPGGVLIRQILAGCFFAYGLILAVSAVHSRDFPSTGQLLLLGLSIALFTGRGGRFVRDWAPVILAFQAYFLAGQFAERLDMPIHFLPQIEVERAVALGEMPTLWLQEHLYRGDTGVLEILSFAFYLSHYFMPVVLGLYLWLSHRRDAFNELMFGIIAVSILAQIAFVLAPTAPPWLAAERGFLPPVEHILKEALVDMGYTTAAAHFGNPASYNIVAAIPSLHAAWPLVALLVCWRRRLGTWLVGSLALLCLGVLFTIVYTGEHYLVDALAGFGFAAVAFWGVRRALGTAAAPVSALAPSRFASS